MMNIIIDTDPGADDSMAILMLLANSKTSNVTAITTVAGNADIDSVTKNAIRTLEVANRFDIPVYKGARGGLISEVTGNYFYGIDGFGETTFETSLPERVLRDEIAAVMLVNYVKSMPNEVTILALGPLTNIALAIALYPDFLNEFKQLVILGGSYQGVGNIRPGSEFNFYYDPEAAHLVLSRAPVQKPVTLLPLETVRKAAFSVEWRKNTLGKINSPSMKFLNKIEALSLKKREFWPAYDPAAACILIDPMIVNETMWVSVNVLCSPEIARGVMIVNYNSNNRNIELITKINREILENLLIKNLSSLNK